MKTTEKKTTAKKGLSKPENGRKLSKREIELRKLADEVRSILKKHNVKPFNRAELYAY